MAGGADSHTTARSFWILHRVSSQRTLERRLIEDARLSEGKEIPRFCLDIDLISKILCATYKCQIKSSYFSPVL